MTASTSSTAAEADRRTAHPRRWRVVDIVVGAVLAVAVGFVFMAWNVGYIGPSALLAPLLPGLQGLLNGPWMLAGPLVGLVIRKPGAALYGELVAAVASALVGNQWGFTTVISGLVQGVGAEIVFALVLYRVFRWWIAVLAGAAAAVGGAVYDLTGYYAGSTPAFAATYLATSAASGAVLAGLLAWILVRALAMTGALERFGAGRERVAD
jgi:energy-coupling factor transport system substrate-specific component